MDPVVDSLLDPVIIFFVLGLAIGVLRSALEIPQAWPDSTWRSNGGPEFAA